MWAFYGKNYMFKNCIRHSQFGEDVVLKDWIHKDIKDGYYVDVGCYHPRKFSNTFFI